VLPSQFYRRLKRKVTNRGELQLITAILDDACATYCKHRNARDSEGRRLFQDAKRWVESTDRTWALSFERVCKLLALDPAQVRARLRTARRGGVGTRGAAQPAVRLSATGLAVIRCGSSDRRSSSARRSAPGRVDSPAGRRSARQG
jgi:hypothetical protein